MEAGILAASISTARTRSALVASIKNRVRVFLGIASFNLDAMAANAARIGKWNLIAKPSSPLLRKEPTIWISMELITEHELAAVCLRSDGKLCEFRRFFPGSLSR